MGVENISPVEFASDAVARGFRVLKLGNELLMSESDILAMGVEQTLETLNFYRQKKQIDATNVSIAIFGWLKSRPEGVSRSEILNKFLRFKAKDIDCSLNEMGDFLEKEFIKTKGRTKTVYSVKNNMCQVVNFEKN